MSKALPANALSCDTLLLLKQNKLSEPSRREYLQAMGVVSWLPKAEPWQVIIDNDIGKKPFKPDKLLSNEPGSQLVVKNEKPALPTVKAVLEPTKRVDGAPYPAANQFLKLINWSHQSILSGSAKTLLIICRHKVDEPASSFTRSNTPSQFMLDYVNSLTEIAKSKGLDLSIQLAHLSQAGLADGSVSFGAGLEKTQPDLALILGDETLAQFAPAFREVSKLRGKQITLTNEVDACISYHPFTLIQDPELKRLAFEDLHLVVACLSV